MLSGSADVALPLLVVVCPETAVVSNVDSVKVVAGVVFGRVLS